MDNKMTMNKYTYSNNTNRDFLAPFLNKKITCVGRFVGAKYLRDEEKKGVTLLLRNILVNDEVTCDHAWFIYTKNVFQNVMFGVNDTLKIECSVVEYIDKNGLKKIGFDEITSVENLTNYNELFENINFKMTYTCYAKKYVESNNGYIENYNPVGDMEDELNIDNSNHYILNLSGLNINSKRNTIAFWCGMEDNSFQRFTKNVMVNPYRYEHGILVNEKYFCKINEEAYRQLSTNYFIITCLINNLQEDEKIAFINSFKSKIKERNRERKFMFQFLNSSKDDVEVA